MGRNELGAFAKDEENGSHKKIESHKAFLNCLERKAKENQVDQI